MKTNIALAGVKAQELIAKSLDLRLVKEALLLRKLDTELWRLYTKMEAQEVDRQISGESRGYIWRSQDDSRVRVSHAQNDDREFSWEKPPASGHPGEDFNCRCWAEPLGDSYYASQLLITEIKDNPRKWSDAKLTQHYLSGGGVGVTLSQIGYLRDVIEYYATKAKASDGKEGVYRAVDNQIIAKALEKGEGTFIYDFNNTYDFQEDVLFTLGRSTISGVFVGDSIKKGEHSLVISGFISYDFADEYKDPASLVETLVDYLGFGRQEAEDFIGEAGDLVGTVYPITDSWQTKFNATVRIE